MIESINSLLTTQAHIKGPFSFITDKYPPHTVLAAAAVIVNTVNRL